MPAPITITDEATPGINRIVAGLRNKEPMNRMVGNRVRNSVRDHLIKRSNTKANRLGAPSSGFWGKAAEVTARAPLDVDQQGVSISLEHPGMARAFRDVTIRPTGGKKYLTIPRIAAAYNKRAYRMPGLFPLFKKGAKSGALAKRGPDGKPIIFYSLVPSVFQRQDRTILPTDDEIRASALQGVGDYVAVLLQTKSGGAR